MLADIDVERPPSNFMILVSVWHWKKASAKILDYTAEVKNMVFVNFLEWDTGNVLLNSFICELIITIPFYKSKIDLSNYLFQYDQFLVNFIFASISFKLRFYLKDILCISDSVCLYLF